MRYGERWIRSRVVSASVAIAAALGTSCAPKTIPLSSPDPSDPAAGVHSGLPYQPTIEPESSRVTPAAIPHPEHEHVSDELVYACPMHPDVTGGEGDTCHLCGMTLVPEKDPPK